VSPLEETPHTVLVVDDCDLVLEVLVDTLKSADFAVLQADSGHKALDVAAAHAGRIDLLLVPVEMPKMSGSYLGDELKKVRPGMQVMLTCGDVLIGEFGCALIQKPFMPTTLISMIKVVLRAADRRCEPSVSTARAY
jgi:DNA-binding response OmpR family regulator